MGDCITQSPIFNLLSLSAYYKSGLLKLKHITTNNMVRGCTYQCLKISCLGHLCACLVVVETQRRLVDGQ